MALRNDEEAVAVGEKKRRLRMKEPRMKEGRKFNNKANSLLIFLFLFLTFVGGVSVGMCVLYVCGWLQSVVVSTWSIGDEIDIRPSCTSAREGGE